MQVICNVMAEMKTCPNCSQYVISLKSLSKTSINNPTVCEECKCKIEKYTLIDSFGVAAGATIQGQKVLEVPVQNQNTIPQDVLDYATNEDVIIRDINGKCYNLVTLPQC